MSGFGSNDSGISASITGYIRRNIERGCVYGGSRLHPDVASWAALVSADGGSVTPTEMAHLSTLRSDWDSVWSKLRDVRICCLTNTYAKRRALKASWGAAKLILTGPPPESAQGYAFDGTNKFCDTGLVPNSVAELDITNHMAMCALYEGTPDIAADYEIWGQTQSGNTLRIGLKAKSSGAIENFTGYPLEVSFSPGGYTGPRAGTWGWSLDSSSPLGTLYRAGLGIATDTTFSTTTKGTNSELIGKQNGGLGLYYKGTVMCLIRGMKLTQAEYVVLSNAWEKFVFNMGFCRSFVARGDSLAVNNSTSTALNWTIGTSDSTLWYQYGAGKERAVGGTTVSQIDTALATELASAADGCDTWKIPLFSAGRNNIRTTDTASAIHAGQLGLLARLPPAVAAVARFLEVPRQVGADEDPGSAYGDKVIALKALMDASFSTRVICWVHALMSQANLATLSEVQELDAGLIPSRFRLDALHPNATGRPITMRMVWEYIRYGPYKIDNAPTNVYTPLVWITNTAGSAATVGQVLKVTPGGWGGNPTYTYQWQKDGVNIGGATSSSYTTVAAGALTCVITATNGFGGPVTATSNTITVA